MRHAGLPRRRADATASEAVRCTVFVAFLEQAARLAGDDLLGFNLGLELRPARRPGSPGTSPSPRRRCARRWRTRCATARCATPARVYALEDGDGAGPFPHRQPQRPHARQPAGDRVQGGAGARRLPPLDRAGLPAARDALRAPARRPSRRAIERRFNCPVRFGAEVTEMVLSPEQLELPVRGADPHLLALRHRPRRGGAGRGRRRAARRPAGAGRAGGARGAAEGRADARGGGGGARDRRADAGAAAGRRGGAVPADRRRAAPRPGEGLPRGPGAQPGADRLPARLCRAERLHERVPALDGAVAAAVSGGAAGRREAQGDDEAGGVVAEDDGGAVQPGDGGDQREAEAGAGAAAARVETDEAARARARGRPRRCRGRGRRRRAPGRRRRAARRRSIAAALRRVAQGVVDEVREREREQLDVARDDEAGRRRWRRAGARAPRRRPRRARRRRRRRGRGRRGANCSAPIPASIRAMSKSAVAVASTALGLAQRPLDAGRRASGVAVSSAAASSSRTRRPSGLRRSWARLSVTMRRSETSASMRSSMALRVAASPSNSSPVPRVGTRRSSAPAMIAAGGAVDLGDAAADQPRQEPAGGEASGSMIAASAQSSDAGERAVEGGAGGDVAADEQQLAAGQAQRERGDLGRAVAVGAVERERRPAGVGGDGRRPAARGCRRCARRSGRRAGRRRRGRAGVASRRSMATASAGMPPRA